MAAEITTAGLFKKYKPAVVKIEILQSGVPVSFGSGFFISGTGRLATNFHVMKKAFSPGYSVRFLLANGKAFTNYKIAACSDKRALDLCVLQLDVKPESHFSAKASAIEVGDDVFVIGHPMGLDYTLSTGIVSGLRDEPVQTDDHKLLSIGLVQITAPISPGNSGGPVFNRKGELLGMSTMFLGGTSTQNLNFAISQGEIYQYAKSHISLQSPEEYSKQAQKRLAWLDGIIRSNLTEPALKSIAAHKPLSKKQFGWVKLVEGDSQFEFALPLAFLPKEDGGSGGVCEKKNDVHHVRLRCMDFLKSGAIEVEIGRENMTYLIEKSSKPRKPRPLNVIQAMMSQGVWQNYESKLTQEQKRAFFSKPSPWTCTKHGHTKIAVTDMAFECVSSTVNEGEPNQNMVFHGAQRSMSDRVIQVVGIAVTPGFQALALGGSTVAFYTLKETPSERILSATPPNASETTPARGSLK